MIDLSGLQRFCGKLFLSILLGFVAGCGGGRRAFRSCGVSPEAIRLDQGDAHRRTMGLGTRGQAGRKALRNLRWNFRVPAIADLLSDAWNRRGDRRR